VERSDTSLDLRLEFVVGTSPPKRTLVFRDAQHEYVFTER
jgi:hypothetical protein